MIVSWRGSTLTVGIGCVLLAGAVSPHIAEAADKIEWESDAGDDNSSGSQQSELATRVQEERGAAPVIQPSGDDNDQVWMSVPRLGSDEDGEYCIERRWIQQDPNEVGTSEAYHWEAIVLVLNHVPDVSAMTADDCPVDPADEVPPQLVESVIRETMVDHLPRPELAVPPGYAMTGMAAYLVTGHELDYGPYEHEVDLQIMQLQARVTGTGSTTVDWGDGTESQTYEQPGLAYPDGEVVHTYTDTGTVTIEVLDRWQLTYEILRDGEVVITDQLELELGPVTLDGLEVRELQAVRTTTD